MKPPQLFDRPVPLDGLDAWVEAGCQQAERLKRQGLIEQAADVLRYVEARGSGLTKQDRQRRYEERSRNAPCSVRDCSRYTAGNRFCVDHMPRFDHGPRRIAGIA